MNLKIASLGLAIVALAASRSAQANILVNGDFENEPNYNAHNQGGYATLTGSDIPGWTVEAGHTVTMHNNTIYPTISGVYSVNMDGEGANGVNANLYQDFATVNGGSYGFSFDWQGWVNNGPSNLDVSVMDTVTSSVVYHGVFGFDSVLHHETASFLGSGNAYRLRLQESPESGFNDNKFIVDNFNVDAPAVPEPASMTALALGAAALIRRRRKA